MVTALRERLQDRIADQRAAHLAQIEDAWLPRAATVVAVVIALIGTIAAGAAGTVDGIVALVLVPAGNYLSWVRRRKNNAAIKALIVVAVVLILMRFFDQLSGSGSFDDARQPLTNLFIGVQVLHAFDLPRRRDLSFTLAASLALTVMAANGVRETWFGLLMVAWLATGWVSLWLLRLSAAYHEAGRVLTWRDLVPQRRRSGAPVGAETAKRTTALVVLAAIVFLGVPRPEPSRSVGLPFRGIPGGLPAAGGVLNPGLPASGGQGGTGGAFDPVAYFGLAETVDVRTVGQLSDQLILRVRSAKPRFWRGMVFDHYEDSAWTRTSVEPEVINGLPARLDGPAPYGRRDILIHTVEVVTETPNLIFAAGEPLDVYHAARAVQQWSDGTVTVGATQDEETLYSVISAVPAGEESLLRGAVGRTPDDILERYTQVPDSVTERTRELAAELVDPTATNYVNAERVQAWIGDNLSYELDLSPHPRGVDAVDHLLFERQLGWCEPIATAMVMLLRAEGIPARFATGFQPGDYDLLSGWWEVRANMAHAWVEVFVPTQGWIAFDPTGAVPQAAGAARTSVTWPLGEAIGRVLTAVRTMPLTAQAGLALVLLLAVFAGRSAVVLRRSRNPLQHLPGTTWEPYETAGDLRARVVTEHPAVDREALDVLVAHHHAKVTERPPPDRRMVERALSRTRASLRRGV
jgi:protein-glutamine gamma-glutamyltransferase